MTISPAQIRAARALLNWSGTDLATRLGMSPTTISMIESGKNPGSMGALRSIEATLVQAGIAFGENDGVSLRKGSLFELHGQEGLKTLMDMIYEHCVHNPHDQVLVNNIRQGHYNEWAKSFLDENRQRLASISNMNRWRILLHEEDVNSNVPTYYEARYLKDGQFGSIGQYCFGGFLALIELSDACHITIIENPRLKDTWHRMFAQLWLAAREI